MSGKGTGLGGKDPLEKTRKVIGALTGKTTQTPKSETSEVMKLRSSEVQRITVPLKDEQVEILTRICKSVMRKRPKGEKRQRITNNSIIRACLDIILPILSSENERLENIKTEEELTERISQILKLKSS